MIPDETVERVRESADIVSIIGEYVQLKRMGNSFRGPCPFHGGTHNNFSVTTRGGYSCFVCGEKGDVFTFMQKHLGMDFVGAVKLVGEKSGVEVREVAGRREEKDQREPLWEVNAAAADFFQQQLQTAPDGKQAREYLKERGLSLGDAQRFGLGFAPRGDELRKYLTTLGFDDRRQQSVGLLVVRDDRPEPRLRFRGRLMFPISDPSGHIVGFGGRVMGDGEPKYLNSAESEIFSKRNLLYGLQWAKNSIRKAERVFIVEGYFDVIRVMLAGIEEVVAPLGTALTQAQAALVRKYTKTAYLLYDSDAAGLKATFRSADILLATGIAGRVITLPDGDDPDTFAAKHGRAGLERLIAQSIDVFDRKVQILERSGFFADVRKKREALDKLLPTIRVTEDRLLRDLYISRAAEVAGVSRDMIERELANTRTRSAAAPVAAAGAPGPGAPVIRSRGRLDPSTRAERELVRMLLHQRQFIERAGEQVGSNEFVDPAARALFRELVARGPDVSVDELIASVDEETALVLQEFLEQAGGLDRAAETVSGGINAIRAREAKRGLFEIERDLPFAREDDQDDMIRRKQLLWKELQSLGKPQWKGFNSPRSNTLMEDT